MKKSCLDDPDFLKLLIPSQTVRENLDWNPTSFELAALISHLAISLEEKAQLLLSLPISEGQEALRAQIQGYVENTKKIISMFRENSNKEYLFVLEHSQGDSPVCGYFNCCESAEKWGTILEAPFTIEKYQFHTDKAEKERPIGVLNPFLSPGKTGDELLVSASIDGGYEGSMQLNAEGQITDVWVSAVIEEAQDVEAYARREYDPAFFRNAYVELPNPFEWGDIVKVVGSRTHNEPDQYGIVATSQQEWLDFNERVKNGLYVDFSDETITIELIDESGDFSHSHISPFYLEKALPEDKALMDYLMAGRSLVLGKGSLEEFCMARQFYRKA